MILHCITSSILKYQTSSPWLNDFYSTRSFIDNKVIQAKGFLVSTLESLVLESEQYHWLNHIFLKCKIQIIKSVRPQSNVPFLAIQLAWVYTRQSLSASSCAQEPWNKARVSGSQQDPYEFLVWTFQCNLLEVLSLRRWNSSAWNNFTKRKSDMRVQIHWHCDLDCQLIANLLHSFVWAVILSIRSF